MALIKCSECGKEISNKVSNCPNCGCPIRTQEFEGEKNKKSKKICLLIAFFFVIIFAVLIIYITKASRKENIIAGEWEFSGLSRGDRHFTNDQLEALGIQIQGNASFTEKEFIFSLEKIETIGIWKEVDYDNGDDDKYFYELITDSGATTTAIIDTETGWLYITIPNDEYTMIVYEKQ